MLQKRIFLTADDTKLDTLQPLLKRILNKRAIRGEEEQERFLAARLADLNNPFHLKGMSTAVQRLKEAVQRNEKVIIYGDYDVDGITATTLLYLFLKQVFSFEVDYYLPDRLTEGYGLNSQAVQSFIEQGYDLLLTVDCGITAFKEADYAQAKGLDLIITDHHQVKEKLPSALAVIDPHRKDEDYPFPHLAGVGVAFKLCQALEYERSGSFFSPQLQHLLGIVALGTVADLVPLQGENRVIVKHGLKILNQGKVIGPGFEALIKKLGLQGKEITAGHLGYILAPPLNAAGRLKDARKGIELLTTSSRQRGEELAGELVELNRQRQELEERIYQDALLKVETEIDLKEETAIVLASEEWHHGVIGIVASRLVEKYYRPTILIALEGEKGKGSGRSIAALNLHQALSHCQDELLGFGGHAMAAGLEIASQQVDAFRLKFNEYLKQVLNSEDLLPEFQPEAVLKPEEISLELVQELEQLQPFGVGNPKPKFLLNNLRVKNSFTCGKGNKHLKIILENGLAGIAFNFAAKRQQLLQNPVDVVVSLGINNWQGKQEVQLQLEAVNFRSEKEAFPVYFQSQELIIADKRGCQDIFFYLKKLLSQKAKILLYLNNYSQIKQVMQEFGNRVIYRREGLQELKQGIIIINEQVKIPELEVEDLVLWSLPFSLNALQKVLHKMKTSRPILHLIFGAEQIKINERIIASKLPTTAYLRKLYLYLKNHQRKVFPEAELKKVVPAPQIELVNNSLEIFQELNLIDREQEKIILLPEPREKLDLSKSMSYNDSTGIVSSFQELKKLVMTSDLFELINKLREDF